MVKTEGAETVRHYIPHDATEKLLVYTVSTQWTHLLFYCNISKLWHSVSVKNVYY